jgi:hypothetical protein
MEVRSEVFGRWAAVDWFHRSQRIGDQSPLVLYVRAREGRAMRHARSTLSANAGSAMPAPIFEALALAIRRQAERALLQGECGGHLLGGQQGDQRQEDVTCGGIRAQLFALLRKRPNCCAAAK